MIKFFIGVIAGGYVVYLLKREHEKDEIKYLKEKLENETVETFYLKGQVKKQREKIITQSDQITNLCIELDLKEKEFNSFRRNSKEYVDKLNKLYNDLLKEVDKYNDLVDVKNTYIKKAIKKAMIDSHPDKGGNSADFIAYKKIYDKIKK